MATIKMPFIHKIRKSMAENTYCRWRDKNILKTKIDSNSSNTLLQQMQKIRWKATVELLDLFDEAAQIGFCRRPADQSPANAFCSANVMVAVDVNEETMETTILWDKIIVSAGRRKLPEGITATLNKETRSLNLIYDSATYGKNSIGSDIVWGLAVEKSKGRSMLFETGTRAEGTAKELILPAQWSMEEIEFYVFVTDAKKKIASHSLHVTLEGSD